MTANIDISAERRAAAESAELKQLADIPIDDVLALASQAGDERELYYRWERQQWEAGAIDFDTDRRTWTGEFTPSLREGFLNALSFLYVLEEQAARVVIPFVDAAPTEEQHVFLTTQLADEARHWVFFDRLYSEVLGEGEAGDARLDAQLVRLTPGGRSVLNEMLPRAAARLRPDEKDFEAFAEGIFLYHLVVEGGLALALRRFLVEFARERDALPGFRMGTTAVARDATRHCAFAIRCLGRLIQDDERRRSPLERALEKTLPVARSAFEGSPDQPAEYEALGFGPGDVADLASGLIERHLRAAGIGP